MANDGRIDARPVAFSPRDGATWVFDNTDLEAPTLTRAVTRT